MKIKKYILSFLLCAAINCCAEPSQKAKEIIKYLEQSLANPQQLQKEAFSQKLMKLPDAVKKECADIIISEKTNLFFFLMLFMKPNEIFDVSINKLEKDEKLSKRQKMLIFSFLQGLYLSNQVDKKQKDRFPVILKKGLTDPDMRRLSLSTAKRLKIKALIPELVKIFKEKETKPREKMEIVTCLKALEYDKVGDLENLLRKEVADSGDSYLMEEFAEDMKDKKMALEIDIRNLESEDDEERLEAVLKLRKATGKNFGFNPIGSKEDRQKAVEKWKALIK